MDRLQDLTTKYELVTSDVWPRVRTLMLNHVVSLANSSVDPLIIQGMLKNIADTDRWEQDFLAEKERITKAKKE